MVVINLFLLLAFAVLLVAFVRKLPVSYTLFAAPQVIVILCITKPVPLNSACRYLLVLFPVFVALALLGRNRWLDQGWVVLSTVFLGFFTVEFLRNIFIA